MTKQGFCGLALFCTYGVCDSTISTSHLPIAVFRLNKSPMVFTFFLLFLCFACSLQFRSEPFSALLEFCYFARSPPPVMVRMLYSFEDFRS